MVKNTITDPKYQIFLEDIDSYQTYPKPSKKEFSKKSDKIFKIIQAYIEINSKKIFKDLILSIRDQIYVYHYVEIFIVFNNGIISGHEIRFRHNLPLILVKNEIRIFSFSQKSRYDFIKSCGQLKKDVLIESAARNIFSCPEVVECI